MSTNDTAEARKQDAGAKSAVNPEKPKSAYRRQLDQQQAAIASAIANAQTLGAGLIGAREFGIYRSAQWNRDGGLVAGSSVNAILGLIAIERDADYSLNEWTGEIENTRPFPSEITGEYQRLNVNINLDAAARDAKTAVEVAVGYSPTTTAMRGAIETVASLHRRNPVAAYFDSLPNWDGTQRLERLTDYFGAEDTELNNATLALIPRAAYARATSALPVKFDYCPILYSQRQGVGKTRSLEAFAIAPEYYREGMDFSGFDTQRKVQERTQGALVIELGEIGDMSRREMALLKSLITTLSLTNRMVFRHAAETQYLRCIFAGTTNEKQMLVDTENRRFPVVECTQIDVDSLRADMPQIYAEVKAQHDKKATEIALPRHLWAQANDATDPYRLLSEFEVWASEYLDGLNEVAAAVLTANWIASDQFTRVSNAARSAIMTKLGWEGGRGVIDGKRVRIWRRIDKRSAPASASDVKPPADEADYERWNDEMAKFERQNRAEH